MADYILLQKGDLDPAVFSNNNTNNAGGVSIKLSSDAGNLLQKRNNGLYYGIEAPPDTRNLYVSSSMGDDSNKGTRAEPLKTIREAYRRNQVGTTFTVNLYEDDTHPIHGSWRTFMDGKRGSWRPYGTAYDAAVQRVNPGSGQIAYSQEVRKPVVKVVYDGTVRVGATDYARANFLRDLAPVGGQQSFQNIVFDMNSDSPYPLFNHWQTAWFGWDTMCPNLFFSGCHFITKNNVALIGVGQSATISFNWCSFDNSNGGYVLSMSPYGNATLAIENHSKVAGSQHTALPGVQPLTYSFTNPLADWRNVIAGSDNNRTSTFNILTRNNPFA